MADQREAVEMAQMVEHWHGCHVDGCAQCDAFGPQFNCFDVSKALARAVIALDEECRRLRGINVEVQADLNEIIDVMRDEEEQHPLVPPMCRVLDKLDEAAKPDRPASPEPSDVAMLREGWYLLGLDTLESAVALGDELKKLRGRVRYLETAAKLPPLPTSVMATAEAPEPSEADVEAVARRLMLTWSAHVEARDADETADGDGDVTIVAMSFDEASALAREAIRLGARRPR